jgi:hypothetical protein
MRIDFGRGVNDLFTMKNFKVDAAAKEVFY